MPMKDEFIKQWQNFSAVIESEMIRIMKENDTVSSGKINSFIQREAGKWNSSTQLQGIWLNKLFEKSRVLGAEFKKSISEIKISSFEKINYPSIMPYAAGIAAVGVLSFFISKPLIGAAWKIAGIVILSMGLSGSILIGLWQESKSKMKSRVISDYMGQLNKYKEQLSSICEKAEKV